MRTTKFLFIVSIILIFLSTIILTNQKQIHKGTIQEVKYQESSIKIKLIENNNTYIIFTKGILNLNQNDKVKIYVKESESRKKNQYIINKLYLSNG